VYSAVVQDTAAICASNNVDWYRSMFAAHGLPDQCFETHWQTEARAPAYHSNLVTLIDGDHRPAIAALAKKLHGPWTLKDAFGNLDLAPMGFDILFDAQWIWRDPAPVKRPQGWSALSKPVELKGWESQLHLSMVTDPAITFLTKVSGGKIVARCIANRSSNAIGLSNIEAPTATLYAEAADAVAALAPNLPVVGYERDDALAFAHAAGFRSVGGLTIWTKPK
jgi:hypothetical protein